MAVGGRTRTGGGEEEGFSFLALEGHGKPPKGGGSIDARMKRDRRKCTGLVTVSVIYVLE